VERRNPKVAAGELACSPIVSVIDAISPGRNRAVSPDPIGGLVESGQPTAICALVLKDALECLHLVPRNVLRNTKAYLIGSVGAARIARRPIVSDARSLRALRLLAVGMGLDLGELLLGPVAIATVS
jgi:hypothetical protein